MVHIFIFVQKKRTGLKYSFFICTIHFAPYCPVTSGVNSGILEQWDKTMMVGILKQCCLLSSNVPIDFFVNQKDEFISDL